MSRPMTNAPIPGQGLTTDPNSPQPHEGAPDQTEMNSVVGIIFDDLTSKEKLPAVIKLFSEKQIFIDRVVSAYIEEGLVTGRWNTDMAHTLIEPTLFIFMWIAAQTGSPIVFRSVSQFDSSGMDVIGAAQEEKIEEAVESLLAPDEDTGDVEDVIEEEV